jgi:predicted enzyme related to lactoylglutathione lyase
MNWTLELVLVPVSDVDRAKAFYAEQLNFNVDHDSKVSDDFRIVQLTPPGSGCSIAIGVGMWASMEPGSLEGLQLVVNDLNAAVSDLAERGVDVSEVQIAGRHGFRPAEPEEELNNVGCAFFSDPDGNRWVVQQITARD